MKKLINDPRNVVREMLEGLADLTPDLALLDTEDVALRAGSPPPAERPVAVISGGGDGHEPAHAGYVGSGMLSAAVTGDVFTSPSSDAVLAAIRATAGPAGALLIVKNYTGDRLNFGIAAELARAQGIPVELVVVADDVALAGVVAPERRRGIAGTVLVHKIAGAAAAAGLPLTEVAQSARSAAARVGTMGVALGACTVPTAGKRGFTLGEREIELGLGIHGEKGVERGEIRPADELVEHIISRIADECRLKAGDRVALLVNGLGATPPQELAIVARHALASLRQRGIAVERAWSGDFLTALEMPGCSLSVLKLETGDLQFLDAPAGAPAWPGAGHIPANRSVVAAPATVADDRTEMHAGALDSGLRGIVMAIADALEAAEARLTDLDSRAGDGDLGASMVRGAQAIRALPASAWSSPSRAITEISSALRRAIAGSSGPFYAIALARAGRYLAQRPTLGAEDWVEALELAVSAVSEAGGAKPGDRTMLDALEPAVRSLRSTVGLPAEKRCLLAADAAKQGAEATASMSPRLGRASYLGERAIGMPDAGAAAVAIWLQAIAEARESV
ncbi:dihydroxyacetone kinase family protein [Mesorhizobium sp. BAC0120]|uniref:dihydroxyacetone kinase family protein n=1 Tax=Mesorhizobium sp. BAC0120 TaxID=3090670 RepID=UPI00298C1771|nr:dihydroxyacetone kinase family protein [Mesorhizobium sp. BAC0120]MDW6024982.1 dihydroxyacetone kinase family protein [Mesorhizobium sp. BAC0120]